MAAVKRINGGSLKLKKLKSNFDSVHRHATTNNSDNNKQRISVTPTTISRLSASSSIYSRTAPLNIPSINHQQSQQSQQKLQCPRPQFSYLPSCVSVTEQTETKEKEIESSIIASEHNQCQDQDQDDMSTLVKHPFLCHDSDSSNSDSSLDYSSQYDYDEGEIKSETKAINDRSCVKPPVPVASGLNICINCSSVTGPFAGTTTILTIDQSDCETVESELVDVQHGDCESSDISGGSSPSTSTCTSLVLDSRKSSNSSNSKFPVVASISNDVNNTPAPVENKKKKSPYSFDSCLLASDSVIFQRKWRQFIPAPNGLPGLIPNTTSSSPLSSSSSSSPTKKKLFNGPKFGVVGLKSSFDKDVTLNMHMMIPKELNIVDFKLCQLPLLIETPDLFEPGDLKVDGMSTKLGHFNIEKIEVHMTQKCNILGITQSVIIPLFTQNFTGSSNKPEFDIANFQRNQISGVRFLNTTLGEFISDERTLLEMRSNNNSNPLMPSMSLPDSAFIVGKTVIHVGIHVSTLGPTGPRKPIKYLFKNPTQLNCLFNGFNDNGPSFSRCSIKDSNNNNGKNHFKVNNLSTAFHYKREFGYSSKHEKHISKIKSGNDANNAPLICFLSDKVGCLVSTSTLFTNKDVLDHTHKMPKIVPLSSSSGSVLGWFWFCSCCGFCWCFW
ncbi:unnamed protein product [Ambrosiozyma monospora]|uniref:Unnamed protein product n=1 Tax=Ambrosiozyma monospora TaxID=43982 RepID=A0A9W7DHR2_AMBMO|nr:unnamed protein product [Ambrosiozyma monospora]